MPEEKDSLFVMGIYGYLGLRGTSYPSSVCQLKDSETLSVLASAMCDARDAALSSAAERAGHS